MANITTEKKNLVVTRMFDVPVERAWKAWTDPEQLMRWWGPEGFTSPVARIDLREGGKSLVGMRSPDGQDYFSTWTYSRIVPMLEIEFIDTLSDKDGNRIDPADIGMPEDFPQDLRTTITFKEVDGKTEMTVTEYDWTIGQMFDLSSLGLNQSLDKMAASFAEI